MDHLTPAQDASADGGSVPPPRAELAAKLAQVEQQLAEAQLAARVSEQRYRMIFDAARDVIFTVATDGTFLSLSPAFEQITQWHCSDWEGKPFLPLLHPDDHQRVGGLFARAFQGELLPVFEVRYQHRDGKYRVAECTTTPQIQEDRVVCVLGIARDITERQQLEQQLFHAQKMEAIGRLAGGVAHDFNNLLTVINGYCEMLLEDGAEQCPHHAEIREIRKAGDRAASLTRQLLAFSRRTVMTPVLLDLNAQVNDLQRLLGRLIGEDIELRVHLDPALGPVRVDRGQLEQVIMNLVVNARDAMPRGGRITIATNAAYLDAEQAAQRGGLAAGHYSILSVTDTGCGIHQQLLPHLFEPFFTTKDVGKGTGLGLAVAFGIMKQSGGHIEVESCPGQGTTFRLLLPRIAREADAAQSDNGVGKTPHGRETVLLVEDEDGVRGLARTVLEACGYTVFAARDGLDALQTAQTQSGPIQILVTDVVMPRMSGRELADRLLAEHPDLKVLYVSGYTDDAAVRHGVLNPGKAFLAKPFTPATLARKVRDVLDGVPMAGHV